MSWLYSQALVEEYLVDTSLDGEQSVPLSGGPTQQAYCASDKMKEFSRLSRFGMTFKPLTEDRGEELLTLYLEGFHAKTSAQQERAQDLTESDQECGITWRGWLAKYDPDTSLWKTPQCSLLGEEQESLEILPKWGMTVNGLLWEQPMLEPITRGKESGSKPRHSLPTPTCNPHLPNLKSNTTGPKNLMQVANGQWEHLMPQKQTWPTPRSCSAMAATITPESAWNEKRNPNLETIVGQRMFPTPTAHNAKECNAPSEQNRNTPTLATHAGGKLNPMWVEWLMGWPLGWTDLKPLVMDKSHYAPPQHGDC